MVQLMKSGNLKPEPETTNCRNKLPVKLEIVEDFLEEEHGPLNKRSKASPSLQQQWSSETNGFPIPPSHYDPLDEPSPLGLQLRKSTSLLDLIQMRLSQSGSSTLRPAETDSLNAAVKKESKGTGALATTDKLKASNFPASLLRIGQWEYKSRYEGDLVAKCYFAKHKLVWEVLEGGLKSKIEIQWSDIMALKANCPDDGPGTLNVVLARPPLFFRETNPQPRKHTLWQAAVDFTDGQASMHKQHFLQCAQGLLNKHFEKLIQCDTRLNFISRQPEIILDSPYFDEQPSVFQDPKEQKGRDFDQVGTSAGSTISSFQNLASPVPAQSSSLETDIGDPASIASEHAPSPSSVMDTRLIEGTGICQAVDPRGPSNWDQIKVTGLRTSMSVSDFVNHIGQCLSEQVTSGIPSFYGNAAEYQGILEEMTQYLLSDTQLTTASDEKSLMSRVNSLCCLLQKDTPTATNAQVNGGPGHGNDVELNNPTETMHDNKSRGDRGSFVGNMAASSSKQPPGMPRIDSLGDMLLQLPRIASIPKLLFNISEEDGDSQAR